MKNWVLCTGGWDRLGNVSVHIQKFWLICVFGCWSAAAAASPCETSNCPFCSHTCCLRAGIDVSGGTSTNRIFRHEFKMALSQAGMSIRKRSQAPLGKISRLKLKPKALHCSRAGTTKNRVCVFACPRKPLKADWIGRAGLCLRVRDAISYRIRHWRGPVQMGVVAHATPIYNFPVAWLVKPLTWSTQSQRHRAGRKSAVIKYSTLFIDASSISQYLLSWCSIGHKVSTIEQNQTCPGLRFQSGLLICLLSSCQTAHRYMECRSPWACPKKAPHSQSKSSDMTIVTMLMLLLRSLKTDYQVSHVQNLVLHGHFSWAAQNIVNCAKFLSGRRWCISWAPVEYQSTPLQSSEAEQNNKSTHTKEKEVLMDANGIHKIDCNILQHARVDNVSCFEIRRIV